MNDSAPLPTLDELRVCVIGLGYVGLPLAVEFGKLLPTLGFDIDDLRVQELNRRHDSTGEIEPAELAQASHLAMTSKLEDIAGCNVYIVAVPTPIDAQRQPNLRPLIAASETVGRVIGKGDVVIYESTVYPGATEEDCLPVVERVSGLVCNRDFYAGYSPERINPGDKMRPLRSIVKVTSGSTPEAAELIDVLYRMIIEAGTFKASSIKVAEASKIIENTQRDVNIALVNELSIIFSHLGVDTAEVLDAAATKWNFIRLTPGLVGGHCIGIDPYYLVHKSMAVGHIPDIIRQSREINDGMARNAAQRLIKTMIRKEVPINRARVLVLGVTFKENCSDIRNTKVIDLVRNLEDYGMQVDICDIRANPAQVRAEFNREIMTELPPEGAGYQAIVLAVAHREFATDGIMAIKARLMLGGVLFDMKAMFDRDSSDLRL